jgi:hypothetical protein
MQIPDSKLTVEKLDEEKRRWIIIDFINQNQGCTAEDVVKGQAVNGRDKTFKILKSLKAESIIFEEISERNKRNKKLFVNSSNPLVLLQRELETFEAAYLLLIERLKEKFEMRNDSGEYFSRAKKFKVFMNILSIYEHIIKSYLSSATYSWPRTVRDTESLSKLYAKLFSRLSQIQLSLANTNRDVLNEYDAVDFMLVNHAPNIRPGYKKSLIDSCKEFRLEKEMESVLHLADRLSSKANRGIFEGCGGKIRVGGDENRVYSPVRIVDHVNGTILELWPKRKKHIKIP